MSRIIILGSAHPLRGGGLATFNERLARAFMDEGHEVTVYTFSLQYPSVLFPGKTQYTDEEPPGDLDIRVKVNSINPMNWYRVGRELKRLKPDLLVVRYWLPFMAPCLGKISSITRKNKHTRVVAIADNIVPHEQRPGDRLLTKYFLKRVDGFVTMSEQVRRDLLDFGVAENRITFCPHPLYDNFGEQVDRDVARRQLGLDGEQLLVLFFGFIRDYKGLDLLIQSLAYDKIRNLPLRLVVAGEFYTDQTPYFKLAHSLGVSDRIIWRTEFIPNDEVKYYFCAADLVVQPYKSATQSGVTQVAYHFEKPMVVTHVGGLPEMVPDGKAGYVTEVDSADIAAAISDFFMKEKQAYFSRAIRKEKKRFSWKRLVESIMKMAVKPV